MRWPYFRVDVEGDSMLPTYLEGDRLLVRRRGRRLRAGDAIVYANPADPERHVVSRIVEIKDRSRPTVAGDNPSRGSASRDDLRLEHGLILGRVVARLSGVERPGRRTYG